MELHPRGFHPKGSHLKGFHPKIAPIDLIKKGAFG